ncbi:MAG TPA: hypothetical protein VIO15_01425 [Bacteroidales bacterium]
MDYLININTMKKLMCVIILMLLFANCSDIKIPKEPELKQYPWIEVFTPGRLDFKGIKHNLDLGTYSFSFKTSYSSIDTFFKIADSSAVNDKWEIIEKSDISRKYKKKSIVYPAFEGINIVTLTFNPEDGRVTFTSFLK